MEIDRVSGVLSVARPRSKREMLSEASEKLLEAQKIVDAKAGSKGNWTADLNGKLEPATVYKLDNGHSYLTDSSGRVQAVEGNLSLIKADRNTYQQCVTGKCGAAGDEGGHLIASALGGAGDKINIVPQSQVLIAETGARCSGSSRRHRMRVRL